MKKTVISVLIVLIGLLALRAWVFQVYSIPGQVMSPTIQPGDRVLVYKLIYAFRPPHRGDITIFNDPRQSKWKYVRRCIAVSGDIIEMGEGLVFLNGSILNEPYLHPTPIDSIPLPFELDVWNNWGPYTVPQGQIFVMGDHRSAESDFDSRFDGMLDVRYVVGKVIHIF